MPKIPTYEAQVNPVESLPGQNPDRVYAEPMSFGSGRGMTAIGAGLMEGAEVIHDVEQRQEVSDIRARMATLRGEMTASFAEQASETAPGDKEFGGKFMADLTNKLAQLGGEPQTRAGRQTFQQESAGVTADFLAKTANFTAASAGAKAVADFQTTVNQNAGTLFNDPSQFDSIMKGMEANFKDPNGSFANVPPGEKAHLELVAKEQLAIAGARGVVRMSPDLAEKQYNAGTLPGQKMLTEAGNAQIVSYIQTAQNAERTKKALAIAQQEHAMVMAAESDGNAILRNIVKNPSDPGITDQILNSRMKWSQKQTMLNIAESTGTGSGEHNSYGKGFYEVYRQIHEGKITSPEQLYTRVGPQVPLDTKSAPGMVRPGNIDPWNRPSMRNPDGSYSTTSSISVGTDKGEVLIPTVINGKRLSNEAAIDHFKKTGENFGVFKTPKAADDYAEKLHNAQATLYDSQGRKLPPVMGDLTVAGVDRLTAEIMGKRTPDGQNEADLKTGFVAAFSKQLSGSNDLLHLRDPKGDMLRQQALAWFLPAFEKAKAEGKYPVSVLLDPGSPHSLWAGAMRFKRDPNTMMNDLMSQNPGAPAPVSYKSAAEVAKAYKAGQIDRATASAALRQNGWAK